MGNFCNIFRKILYPLFLGRIFFETVVFFFLKSTRMSKKVRLLWFLIYFSTIGNATENNDTSEYMYDILRFNETVHHINAFFDVIYYGFSGKFMIQRDSIEKCVFYILCQFLIDCILS